MRWNNARLLMSSARWPEARHVGGIMSPDPEENPYWWNANHVLIPYCSSDAWTGTAFAGRTSNYAFLGALIIEEVMKQLMGHGLGRADSIILAGTSAGGTGVLLNADLVRSWLEAQRIRATFLAISDSGWFLNRTPFAPTTCFEKDTQKCPASQSVQMGMDLWASRLPQSCKENHPGQHWNCFFGGNIYITLKTPVFIFQWLFDEAQMKADNVGLPLSRFQWDYIRRSGHDFRRSFNNSNAVFAPACMSHTVLTKRSWQTVEIDAISLPQAIRCWELSLSPIEHRKRHNRLGNQAGAPTIELSIELTSSVPLLQADEPGLLVTSKPAVFPPQQSRNVLPRKPLKGKKNKQEEKKKKERRRKRKEEKKKRRREQNKKKQMKKNKKIDQLYDSIRRTKRLTATSLLPESCRHKLMDTCSWPQCNRSCPKLQNPFSGEEMDFIELLRSFSSDLSGLASALGVDPPTLKGISQEDLIRLLSQE